MGKNGFQVNQLEELSPFPSKQLPTFLKIFPLENWLTVYITNRCPKTKSMWKVGISCMHLIHIQKKSGVLYENDDLFAVVC